MAVVKSVKNAQNKNNAVSIFCNKISEKVNPFVDAISDLLSKRIDGIYECNFPTSYDHNHNEYTDALKHRYCEMSNHLSFIHYQTVWKHLGDDATDDDMARYDFERPFLNVQFDKKTARPYIERYDLEEHIEMYFKLNNIDANPNERIFEQNIISFTLNLMADEGLVNVKHSSYDDDDDTIFLNQEQVGEIHLRDIAMMMAIE